MAQLRGFIARLRKNEVGATMIEYSILIGIITALVVGSIVIMGGRVQSAWSSLVTATTQM
jgi:pilus assembly protein Flp/PilA